MDYDFDGNSNVVSMTNTNGTMVARYSCDPFGNILGKSGTGVAGAGGYTASQNDGGCE
ncbi:MAG TPA: hypothetical protein VN673_08615 [Clostridia bacterium]|nr:hypothetical protein [Clostridia bacterium]